MSDKFDSDTAEATSDTRKGQQSRLAGLLPSAAWRRVTVLFIGLITIKAAMLFSLQKHLFETHWRVMGVRPSWLDEVVFHGFGLVGVLCVVGMGRWCAQGGAKTVRWANAVVMGLGLLFIFLTFHEGSKNYVSRIMDGNLGWSGLIPYLSLKLFFNPPYLAAWLVVYAVVYLVLARKGREAWALNLTAVAAGLYWMLCFREYVPMRRELMTAGMIGVATLFVLWRAESPMKARWLLWPLAWTVFIWLLFSGEAAIVVKLTPYFALLAGELAVLFLAVTWLAKRRGFIEPWLRVSMFFFVSFLLLSCLYFPMADNYRSLLKFSVAAPHYFIGEALLALVVAGVAIIARCWCGVKRWWWLDCLVVLLLLVALVDLRVTQIMDVRVGWDLITFADSPKMMLRMAKPYLPMLALACLALIAAYAVLLMGSKRLLWRDDVERRSNAGARFVGIAFALLGLVGWGTVSPDIGTGQVVFRMVQTSPMWKRTVARPMSDDEFRSKAAALGMNELIEPRPVAANRERRDLNVLLVFMESSYNKHLSLFGGTNDTQPLLSQYRDRMELFPNFYSSFASSIHARFATFTGLYPVADFSAFTLERVGVKSVFEVLNENGYACSMFYSSFFDYTGFRQMLNRRGLAEMYDADTMPGERKSAGIAWGLQEEETLEAIKVRVKQYAASGEKFFLTYVPAAPHYPYDHIPERFKRYKPDKVGDYTPFYLNELLYMDWVIASLLDELKAGGLLDKTLVVITGDHGEMLGGDDGAVGHGWKITPELANVPLIVMDPQKAGASVNCRVGSQVDLLPTLLDVLGIPLPDAPYQGSSLYGSPTTKRTIYLNSYRDWAVIREGQMTISDRGGGGESESARREVYDIGCGFGSQGWRGTVTNVSVSLPAVGDIDSFQARFLRNYERHIQRRN